LKTANTVLEALFTTLNESVEEAASAPQTVSFAEPVVVPTATRLLSMVTEPPPPLSVKDDDPRVAVAVALPSGLVCMATAGATE
jgi:hypothetical protein